MNVASVIIDGSCWAVLIVYSVSTLLILWQPSYIGYATSFLLACALWTEIVLFDIWFIFPAFLHDVAELELPAVKGDESIGWIVGRTILSFSKSWAVVDLVIVLVGCLASTISLSNSFELWQLAEQNLDAIELNHQNFTARQIFQLAKRANDYLGFRKTNELELTDNHDDIWITTLASVLFAIPRRLHRCNIMRVTLSDTSNVKSCSAFEKRQGTV